MKPVLFIVALFILLGGAAYAVLPEEQKLKIVDMFNFDTIDSFENCVDAGFAVTGGDLPKCVTDKNAVYFGARQEATSPSPALESSPKSASPLPEITESPLASASNEPEPTETTTSDSDKFDPLTSAQKNNLPTKVVLDVPFTPQAPTANWDPPFNEACEETSVVMVERFLRGGSLDADSATERILALTQEVAAEGLPIDTTTEQAASVAEKFYNLKTKVYSDDAVTAQNIKYLLAAGYPVIIPAAGQLLGNPYFNGAGPPYHMLVIIGYEGNEFITNDPGTKRGAGYRYDQNLLVNVIHDWTGAKESIREGAKRMLVLGN